MTDVLIVEVVDGHHMPESRSSKDGQIRWSQKIYVHTGGAFPAEAKMSITDQTFARPIGKYELAKGAYRIGRYGDLELNNFDMHKHLIPVASAKLKQAS